MGELQNPTLRVFDRSFWSFPIIHRVPQGFGVSL